MYNKNLKQLVIKRTDLFTCLSLFDYCDNMLESAGSIWCVIQVTDRQLDLLKRNDISYKEIGYEKLN